MYNYVKQYDQIDRLRMDSKRRRRLEAQCFFWQFVSAILAAGMVLSLSFLLWAAGH